MPFQSPNYTQTPNDFFTHLPDMGEAETKVTLAVVRETFGYHRGEARLSLTKLQKLTGLSRQGVLNGAKDAEERGTLKREQDGGVTLWVVNVVDQGSQPSRPPSNKESSKEKSAPNGAERPPDFLDAMIAHAHRVEGKPDVTFLVEYLQPLAIAFCEEAGTGHWPVKSEQTLWHKTFQGYYERGFRENQVRQATRLHIKEGLSTKGPQSIEYKLKDLPNIQKASEPTYTEVYE